VNPHRAWSLAGGAALLVLLSLLALGCSVGGGDEPEPKQGAGEPPRRVADPGSARFELKIGDLVPLSGELEPFGPPGRKAAELAVAEAEQALEDADVRGVSVEVDHEDTGTDPQGSVAAARRVARDGATCLTGAWASTDTIPAAQAVAAAERRPMISPASTSAQITTLVDEGYLFRTAPSNNLQGETLADVVEDELGGTDKKIAVAARNDAYGQGMANSFRRAWEAKGGELSGGPVLYDPNDRDLKADAERIVAEKPDGYVIADFPDTYARMGEALVETGDFDAGKLFVTDGLAGEGLPSDIPGEALEGARGTRPGTLEEGETAEAFDRLYRRSDRRPEERQTFDAQNFDAAMLCVLAAVAAGSSDGEAIQGKLRDVSAPPGRRITPENLDEGIEALREGQDIDYDGASGPIDFDAQGDPTVGTYEVFEYGPDREFSVDRQIQAEQGRGATDRGEAEAREDRGR
jgi:ABC-type branched-subunit amino acid transport system substrate-binding protein